MKTLTDKINSFEIPEGCTHWEEVPRFSQEQPLRRRFYKVFGPKAEVVFIWHYGVWTPFAEYLEQAASHSRATRVPKKPDFTHCHFHRHCETANDKIKQFAFKMNDTMEVAKCPLNNSI